MSAVWTAESSAVGRDSLKTGVLIAGVAVAALLPAIVGVRSVPAQWAWFVCAALLAGAAMLSGPNGLVSGVAALFAAIALKDAVLVVPGPRVNIFDVVAAGLFVALCGRIIQQRVLHVGAPRGAEWGLIGLPLAGLWSLPTSVAPGTTLEYIARLVFMVALALGVSRMLADDRARLVALRTLALAALPLALFAVLQWLVPDLPIGTVYRPWAPPGVVRDVRPAGFYMDPNFLGAHLAVAAIVALGLAGSERRRWQLWAVAAVALLGVVAITMSRSAWVVTAVGLIVLLVVGGSRVRRIVLGAALFTAILGTLLVGSEALIARARSALETDVDSSNITRLMMMRSSVEMFADNPIAGTGLGTFDIVYPKYLFDGADPTITHPHQVPLALLAQTGLGGAVAMAFLLVTSGVAAVRVCRTRPTHERAVVAALVALAAGAFFQYYIFFEMAWLCAGLLACASNAPPAEPRAIRALGAPDGHPQSGE